MTAVAVTDLGVRARDLADMTNSSFINDAELLRYINSAYRTWYDLVVSAFEDYYVSANPYQFTVGSDGLFDYNGVLTGSNQIYKIAGVDKSGQGSSDSYFPLKPTSWRHRNSSNSMWSLWDRQPAVTYRIFKNQIRFTPQSSAAGNYQIWYVPVAPQLVYDTPVADVSVSSIDAYNGLENLLIVDVAIKMLAKEESDVQFLVMERERYETKMKEMLVDRDIGSPQKIEDSQSPTWSEAGWGGWW
tara:strand:+ start:453 stop:1184 length:732 start_codon:yes stop_codon:yes gene_type:complete